MEALWHLQLPVNIRAHVSNMEFNHTTFKSVFEAADKVFLSAKQVSIAAVATPSGLDETLSAFDPHNQPQVAAFGKGGSGTGKGGGKNKKNKNNKNQDSKPQGSSETKSRGKRHASNPPDSVCSRHYKHGPEAWYCVAPTTCPWKDKVASRP